MAQDQLDLERLLKSHYDELSPSEQKIARFILDNYEDAAFLSISQLGEVIQVSESTLSRLARHLGYASYAQFQQGIQQILRRRLTPQVKMSQTITKRSTDAFSLAMAVQEDAEHLRAFVGVNAEEDFKKAVNFVSSARKVFLAGMGISKSLVYFLEFRLRRSGLLVESLTAGGSSMLEQLAGLKGEDTLVTLGFFRIYPELVAALEWSRVQNAPSVAITESLASPLGRRATVTLVAKRGPVGELNSLALPMVVANALAVGVALARKEETLEHMERLEKLHNLHQAILLEE
ncbi:MurR/RpiR family transcriptional regulator [Neomoorella mulderi]|uniref:HTH-type transcriptional regulator GlvR n=1 Tax=Moorella mulderi DSM 14980 TaxID=1122241 RepID=A0A151AVT2_9FIRM|nr:MurR/RpiR family transcriptional regulator [Moorella mulderi]KYH31748.1 HTH-type transcriptional regulator GlvR [Moorella mulderi DSM 14980]